MNPPSSDAAASPPSATASPHAAAPRPWWIPRFLGTVPDVEPRALRLLGLVALALFFESYDHSMLTSALKHIADGLGVPESELGRLTMWIRLGAVPAFLLVPFADRIGRRRVFLASIVGISVGTCLTAFTQTPLQFTVVQMATRAFLVTGMSVAFVIVTEEMPAEHRGWAVGMLGALAACGVGLGALLFSQIERLPFGWRFLYVVGVTPLLLLPAFRRGIPETDRFTRHREEVAARGGDGGGMRGWARPLASLVRAYPGRALAIATVGFLVSMGQGVVFQFSSYFLQTVHGWRPWQYATLVVAGGLIGILGNVVAGNLGDRFGRRRVGFTMMALFPLFALAFYGGPAATLAPAWVLFTFCTTAESTIVRALTTELFPTSYRGTATGWQAMMETLGAAAGLGLVTAALGRGAELGATASLIGFSVGVAGLVLLVLPETSRRELEAISREDAG